MSKLLPFVTVAVAAFLAFLVLVPKKDYRHYLIFGLLFGGLGDGIVVITLKILNLSYYKGMGNYAVFGILPIWPPVAMAFTFSLFLYLLPTKKAFLIPYIFLFGMVNYTLGLVFQNLGLYIYVGAYRYIAPITFIAWYSLTAWVYFRVNEMSLDRSKNP